MKILFSVLEKNEFSGILVKKGLNHITDKNFEVLKTDNAFNYAFIHGFINLRKEVKEPQDIANDFELPADLNSMNYQKLLAYVKANNIQTKTKSKEDLIKAIQEQ